MYVNCQGALAIKIWPGIFILKNCEVHQNQKNGTKQPNGYILSAYYINGISDEDLTFTGAKKKQEADRYVTQSEIAELETRITAKVMKEVAEMMGRAALGNQGMMINPMMMQSYMQMAQTTQQEAPKENETKDVTEEEDATLQEMSLMFAQGEFGKE